MPAPRSTILVVEDDEIVRMLIVDVLEELGFDVLEAEDGNAALGFIEKPTQIINLLMTDMGLPGMDGKQLAEKARAARPSLPVLFASGSAEHLEIAQDMQIIGKPFSIDQLRDKVKKILEA